MKQNILVRILSGILILLTLASCDDSFDVKYDADFKPEQVFVNYDRLRRVGMKPYQYVPSGFNNIGGAFLAGACDEAEHTALSSSIQKFNLGAWTQYSNPDDQWGTLYEGIYYANFFLEKSVDYKTICLEDTITVNGRQTYEEQITDIAYMREEVRLLRALFHFELLKRYGGVPVITKTLTTTEGLDIPSASIDSCASFIVNECDAVKDLLVVEWANYKDDQYGRLTKGAALALKSRVLLYAASPLYNPTGDVSKWEDAAQAAHDLIAMEKYELGISYNSLFKVPTSYQSREIIFMRMSQKSNNIEKANYPIGTDGGASGTCPSQNLVDAYEMKDGSDFDWNNPVHATDPYKDRDPRLGFTIAVNGSTWNGRPIESYIGGIDGLNKKEASKTGYYLKKLLADGLDLVQNQESVHSWILFRYGEILLNYAEAMNEAYGPDADPKGYGKTARQALNEVRGTEVLSVRRDVKMPKITSAIAADKAEFRKRVKRERQIELAYEEHRFWDVRRWTKYSDTGETDASIGLGAPLRGVSITKDGNNLTYVPFKVEDRSYQNKMLFYPIPQAELNKYPTGFIKQNTGW